MSIGYLLSSDLMWISRVTGTAKELGLEVKAVRKPEQLKSKLETTSASCILIDLDAVDADSLPSLIAEIKPLCSPECVIVAFGSHVMVPLLKAAREAGCDPVLTRGQITAELVELLPRWMAS